MTKTQAVDLRVDLILRVEADHMVSKAGIKHGKRPEEWACRCGQSYTDEGAIKRGRRHVATEIMAALDEAGAVA